MTKKQDDTCMKKIPEGYEVFEKYDSGVMFIRQAKEQLFKANEIKLLEAELKKNDTVYDFKLDINGDLIKVYTVENDLFSNNPEDHNKKFLSEKFIMMNNLMKRFDERMRITIEKDKGVRTFIFERYCYRGRIDDWIFIDNGEDLETLAKENLIHLGKESYYNLM